MQNKIRSAIRCFVVLAVLSVNYSCEKEHLQPVEPVGNTEPLVYISANLDGDSVSFAGGIENYVGILSMVDTVTNYRIFNFSIKNSQTPNQSYFKISINNYQNSLGNPQTDLDSSIYQSSRSYMVLGIIFIPRFVQVYWVDATGVQYKSTSDVPNSFSIINVTDTVVDSKKYKKTELEFECYMNDASGNTIHLTNGRSTALFSVN